MIDTFRICTVYNNQYSQWGYPLLCSIALNYPTAVHVHGVSLSKRSVNEALSVKGVTLSNHEYPNSCDRNQNFYCFDEKAKACKEAMGLVKEGEAIMFVDADSLILDTLDEVYKRFMNSNCTMAVHCRYRNPKEEMKFYSNNIMFKKTPSTINMIDEWIKQIQEHKEYNSLTEQACLYKQSVEHPEVSIFHLESHNLPILHAKGAKNSNNKLYSIVKYDEECHKIVRLYKLKIRS